MSPSCAPGDRGDKEKKKIEEDQKTLE